MPTYETGAPVTITARPTLLPATLATAGLTAYRDDHGRVVLVLDTDSDTFDVTGDQITAAGDLQRLLDDVGPGYELGVSPGQYGVSEADGLRLNGLRATISAVIG